RALGRPHRAHQNRRECRRRASTAAAVRRTRCHWQAEKRRDRRDGGESRGAGCGSAAVQRLQDPPHAKSGEASHRRRTGDDMDVLQWAVDPWGQRVPIHIAWFLIEVAFFSAVAFLIVRAAYIRSFAGETQWS